MGFRYVTNSVSKMDTSVGFYCAQILLHICLYPTSFPSKFETSKIHVIYSTADTAFGPTLGHTINTESHLLGLFFCSESEGQLGWDGAHLR